MEKTFSTRKRLFCCVAVVGVVGMACLIFVPEARVAVFRSIFRGACVTEDEGTITNITGMKFEIVYENCDTLAKEEDVYVYVSTAAEKGDWFLTRWLNRRTLLVSYDGGGNYGPSGRYVVPVPSIQASGDKRILISIPGVADASVRTRQWHDVSIDYDIGHSGFP